MEEAFKIANERQRQRQREEEARRALNEIVNMRVNVSSNNVNVNDQNMSSEPVGESKAEEKVSHEKEVEIPDQKVDESKAK